MRASSPGGDARAAAAVSRASAIAALFAGGAGRVDLAALAAARSLDGSGGGRAPLNKRFALATVQGTCQANRREQVAALWQARDRQLVGDHVAADDAAWEERRREAAARDAALRAEREAAAAEEAAQAAAEDAAAAARDAGGGGGEDALRRLLSSRAKRGRGEVGPATEPLAGQASPSSSSSSSSSARRAKEKRRDKSSKHKKRKKSSKDKKSKKHKKRKRKDDA